MHLTQPLVSIVTPSFNQMDYLEDAIRSVLAQDYPTIEYIVVDGGSTDGSIEIIRKYSHRLAWWISEPDEGQAEAINKGMEHANGEIVAWLNSDDLLLPGAVSQAVQALSHNPTTGFVFGDAITIDQEGKPIKKLAFPDWDTIDLLSFRIICQPAVFIRRENYLRSGGLDTNYHYMLDHHLWLRIACLAPFRHIPALWAAARHHSSAKNVSQSLGFAREIMILLDWFEAQPDLNQYLTRYRRRIVGGAQRLHARYLLDGEQYGLALASYLRAFLFQPGYTLEHWRRILYTFWGLIGGMKFKPEYLRWRNSRSPDFLPVSDYENWPGLCLK
jgi:glycosyltransferase involved in cell wall biosynthesis